MSTIVDTSVWSLFLRRGDYRQYPQARKLDSMLRQRQPIVLLGVVLQETLQGVRDVPKFEKLRDYLGEFSMLAMQREDHVAAATLWNLCRSNGVQASTADCQIAAACIRHDCALLTCDKDFEHISRLCPLQLL